MALPQPFFRLVEPEEMIGYLAWLGRLCGVGLPEPHLRICPNGVFAEKSSPRLTNPFPIEMTKSGLSGVELGPRGRDRRACSGDSDISRETGIGWQS